MFEICVFIIALACLPMALTVLLNCGMFAAKCFMPVARLMSKLACLVGGVAVVLYFMRQWK